MVNLNKLFLPKISERIYRFLLIWVCTCFLYPSSESIFNIRVDEGEESTMGGLLERNPNKIGAGLLKWNSTVVVTGDTIVSERTIDNKGILNRSLTVKAGAIYRSSTQAQIVYNGGNLQTSAVDGAVPHSLRLESFSQTSPTTSILSVKVFPDGLCDFFDVESANLSGNLAVYVAPGDYDHGGVRFPIIRGREPGGILGDFISLINMNHADVVLTHQKDAENYYLVVSGGTTYVSPTPTSYTSGKPVNKNQRHDIIAVGSTAGFSGFETPEEWCEVLFINFIQTGTPAEQNTVLTNSYDGSGEISYLPHHVKEVWLTGDPTGYDIMVKGGLQFALPKPGIGTRIRFAFTKSPESDPLGWFQGDLPRDCGVFVEPGSADPFIRSVLPRAGGGYMVIGSPITFNRGVAGDLIGSQPFSIQKHPELGNSSSDVDKACITLTETTNFPGEVAQIKLRGAYEAVFIKDSNLFNISEETAAAGIGADSCTVKLYRTPDYTLPAVKSFTNSANVLTTTDSIAKAPAPKIPGMVLNPTVEYS
ncbi:MAG: hypothetical protein LW696_00755 [Alphaproteobacteria bacterium]|nr:hypothetical protein [Alphaproteobacteria bacterium]